MNNIVKYIRDFFYTDTPVKSQKAVQVLSNPSKRKELMEAIEKEKENYKRYGKSIVEGDKAGIQVKRLQ